MSKNRVFILGAGVGTCVDIPVQKDLFKALMKFDYSIIGENHYDYKSDKEAISYFLRTYHKDLINENPYPGIEKVLELIHKAHSNEKGYKGYDEEYLNRYFNLNNMLYDYMWNQIRNGGKEKRPDGIVSRESIDLFAEKLKPEDIIINFNYDVAIENRLDRLDILDKLWSYREDGNGIKILKVHGSINWVEAGPDEQISYKSSSESPEKYEIVEQWFDPLTRYTKKYWVVKVPEDEKPITTYLDLTKNKWRVPLIIPPMKEKNANIKNDLETIFKEIRNNAWDSIKNANELYIIGYSLNRKQDSGSVKEIIESVKQNKNLKEIYIVNPDIVNKESTLYQEIENLKKEVSNINYSEIPKKFENWVRCWEI